MTPEQAPRAPDTVQVRRAEASDAHLVAVLLHDFNTEFAAPTPSVEEFAQRLLTQIASEGVRVWLAEDDGETVGFSLLTLRPSPYHDVGVATLDELYARPHRRGTGVGTALLAALLAWVETTGVGEVHINVDESDVDARRFYERHSFTNVETTGDGESRMFLYQREF